MNVKKSILPTCTAHDTIGIALAKTTSSHEPVLVFNNDIFLGLVSPSHVLFTCRYPYKTHAEHCLINPPHITKSTSLFDAGAFMLETNFYAVPVFNSKNEITRFVRIEKILQFILNSSELLRSVSDLIPPHQPITASWNANVGEVYSLMREKKIGRVILVDAQNHLKGIVSRKDILKVFIAKTVHQRYVTRKMPPVSSSFDAEKIDRTDSPIMEFAHIRVFTRSNRTPKEKIVEHMLRSKLPSIVLTKDGEPVGFISRHDILKAFVFLKPHEKIPILWTKHIDYFKEYRLAKSYKIVELFFEKFNRRLPVNRVEVHVDQAKNAVGYQKKQVTVKLHVFLKSGETVLSHADDWTISAALRKALQNLDHQVEISDRQKNFTFYAGRYS